MPNVIGTGAEWPEYIRFIPPDWRDDPVARRVVDGRMTVAGAVRRPATRRADPSRMATGHASSRNRPAVSASDAVAGRAELLGLMARTLEGTPRCA